MRELHDAKQAVFDQIPVEYLNDMVHTLGIDVTSGMNQQDVLVRTRGASWKLMRRGSGSSFGQGLGNDIDLGASSSLYFGVGSQPGANPSKRSSEWGAPALISKTVYKAPAPLGGDNAAFYGHVNVYASSPADQYGSRY